MDAQKKMNIGSVYYVEKKVVNMERVTIFLYFTKHWPCYKIEVAELSDMYILHKEVCACLRPSYYRVSSR